MKLSVVIPCFNEVHTLAELIRTVRSSPVEDMEIILVDDFSTDGTRELIKSSIESQVERVIFHDCNRGKGAALRSGFKAATGEIVVV